MTFHDLPVTTEQADGTAVLSTASGADALINRIDPVDFRNGGNLAARRADPVSGYIPINGHLDIPELGELRRPIIGMGDVGIKPWGKVPGHDITLGDHNPIFRGDRNPYPLPEDPYAGGSRPVDNPNSGALEALNKRIQEQAIKNVQANMSPEEKHRLNEDYRKYQEEMAQHEKAMRGWMIGTGRGNDPPRAPEVPTSVQRYNAAIDAEKDRIASRMQPK